MLLLGTESYLFHSDGLLFWEGSRSFGRVPEDVITDDRVAIDVVELFLLLAHLPEGNSSS